MKVRVIFDDVRKVGEITPNNNEDGSDSILKLIYCTSNHWSLHQNQIMYTYIRPTMLSNWGGGGRVLHNKLVKNDPVF